jgi:hypothetical protein
MSLGPFDVTATQIESLGARFTEFVNRLLDAEGAAHGLAGNRVSVNIKDTTPDGGVDAAIRGAPPTDWLPHGDSAWQFKRGNLGPKPCAAEFGKATWAHEFVRNGGSYILVLGVPLTDNLIQKRRKEIIQKTRELNLLPGSNDDSIRVYDANQLARWASRFPALAVSRLIGGPGSSAVDYDTWSKVRPHQCSWVANDERDAAIRAIRAEVSSNGIVEVRVQGESGIGKTRLVMEALREASLSPLVSYVDDERAVAGDLLNHLAGGSRKAILVIDDCPAERHIKLIGKLPADPAIKLVTIGEPGAAASRTPIINVGPIGEDDTDKFLKANYLQLGPEARRFITDHSRGNIRWTIVLADRVLAAGTTQAAEIIQKNDIGLFVTTLLPEGQAFFCSAVLALVKRVGWDRELRPQLETLAAFARVTVDELEKAGHELEQRGLLMRQGRYRAVGPHPLAVFLAAEAWRTEGERIVSELLPLLDNEMALALFRRVADLGRFEPARSVLPSLLAKGRPFGSLASIEAGGLGEPLTQLAIILPDEVAHHLGELIDAASTEDLRSQTRLRRDLVWTLEKLAWHQRTFESAANSLLRLALAENETYANNAGGTWVDLFGTMLPGTAATPDQRIAYLNGAKDRSDPAERTFVVKACARALAAQNESITVSGELQGGALVEPRGTPATWGEVGDYRRAIIEILSDLVSDKEPAVAEAAINTLISAVHPLVDDPFVGDDLIEALSALRGKSLIQLRRDIENLVNLHERHSPDEGRKLVERLGVLSDALPPPTDLEQLHVLLQLRRWDLRDDQLSVRVVEKLQAIGDTGRQSLVDFLASEDVPAAWELGRALALVDGKSKEWEDALLAGFRRNPAGLGGYLAGLVEKGDECAFDDFLDGHLATKLDSPEALTIAAHGPATDRAATRILELARQVPVFQATVALFSWQRNLSEDDVRSLVSDWSKRVASQQDYNALIDWLNLWLPNDGSVPDALRPIVLTLVMMRKAFPAMAQQRWDWSRLAKVFITDHAVELSELILALIEDDKLMIHRDDYESQVLFECASTHPSEVWSQIAERLVQGGWRVQMEIRGWLLNAIPSDILERWIGRSSKRARIVASVVPVGAGEPTPTARLLLDRFGDDRHVKSSLWGDFVSGTWMGPESGRLEQQVRQLKGWLTRGSEPEGVRSWAIEMIEDLEARRKQALESEAERGF